MIELSIILPFRNAESWILETIDSIRDQDFRDWELICIDDHSEDNTAGLIEHIAQSDTRINVRLNGGTGIIPALQTGFALAKGTFLSRMDADDIMPANRLHKMVHTLASNPGKTVVTGKVEYFGEQPVSAGYRKYASWLNERVDQEDHRKHRYRECVVASPNWMVRTADMKADRILENLRYPEDYDMVFQWLNLNYSIVSIPTVTLLWREHPNRTSRNSDVYDQESFFTLKIDWFLRLFPNHSDLALLGSGRKGKLTARLLDNHGQGFQWFDLNAANYGAGISGHSIRNHLELSGDQVLIAVYPEPIEPLIHFLNSKGYTIGRNAWFL